MNGRWIVWVLLCVLCSPSGFALAGDPVFDVPKLTDMVVDGKAEDWADQGFRVGAMVSQSGPYKSPKNFDAEFRLGWDARGLLVLVTVVDDLGLEHEQLDQLWRDDSVELYVADKQGGDQMVQCIAAPGLDADYGQPRHFMYDHRISDALKAKSEAKATVAVSHTDGGYVMEVLVSWSNLDVEPLVGREVAFQIYVSDSDTPGERFSMSWYPEVETFVNTNHMHRIRLSNRPSQPVKLAGTADPGKTSGFAELYLRGLGEMAGGAVHIRHDGETIASDTLQRLGPRSFATMTLPELPHRVGMGDLEILVDGAPLATVSLSDLYLLRARRFVEAELAFDGFVFSGDGFPECDFKQPGVVERLIGPYETEATYYDADYNEVTKADKVGRYGAVVSIRAEQGRTYTRYVTLFRSPEPWHWWMRELKGELKGEVGLPEQLGIDRNVAEAQRTHVNEMFNRALAEYCEQNRGSAIALAGLYETKPDATEASIYDSPEARNRQWWVTMKRKLNGNDKRFAKEFVCPGVVEGSPAPVVRTGTLEEAGMKPDTVEKIDAVLNEWAANSDEAFIACVLRNGVIVLHKAYGLRDGKSMTTDTKSWMASLTKLLHGTCMMLLVDQGLIDLDASVDAYLPEFAGIEVERPMTLRHMVTHTAGMWRHWGDDVADLEHRTAECYPYLNVGTKLEYNGMSLALASKVIEQITGESLPAFYRKHLIDPLGMSNTDVTNSSYNARSTALDMAKLGQMLLNAGAYGKERFFSEQTLEKMLPTKIPIAGGALVDMVRGVGCTWTKGPGLSERTFTHGSASKSVLLVDPVNKLVISMTRNGYGKNFEEYNRRFIETITSCMLEVDRSTSPEQ